LPVTDFEKLSDRELDAAVAEILFGEDMSPVQHRDMFVVDPSRPPPRSVFCLRCEAKWNRVEDISGVCPWGRTPKLYSSTWEGLGLVVEAMRAKGFRFDMTQVSLDDFASASFASASLAGGRALGKPPRAVAIAALRAL